MSTNLASTRNGYNFLYPHPPCTLRCQSFIYQPQTTLFTVFRYLTQVSHEFSLSFLAAFCLLFKLRRVCYIPRPLIPLTFINYEFFITQSPPLMSRVVWPDFLLHKLLPNTCKQRNNKHRPRKQITT
jgi:hypothetical protein